MARTVAPSIAAAKAPEPVPSAPPADAARRSAEDDRSTRKLEEGRRLVETKKVYQDEAPSREKGDAPVAKAEASKPKENAAKLEPPAPAAPPAPKPAATPAPAPPPPAPLEAAKEPARPTEAPAEKPAMKKDADLLAKQDSDAKAKPPAEPPPTHLTLVSTQLSNDRKSVDEALRKMGVRAVAAAPVAPKGPATRSRDESTMTLELTDRQIARLQQELNKAGRSQVIVGSPGDPVLAQFSDGGLLRGRKDVASAGAAAPAPRKAAEAPKAEAEKAPAAADKESEESAAKSMPEAAADKSGEPRRKVVLHLLEVPVVPDAQPAPDPVKK
jgi:hypothetical protein